MIEDGALLALAPIRGHRELDPQRLARRWGVVDGGIDHLVDGVQQAGDVLDREGSRDPRAFKTEDSGGAVESERRKPPRVPQSPASGKQGCQRFTGTRSKTEGEGG